MEIIDIAQNALDKSDYQVYFVKAQSKAVFLDIRFRYQCFTHISHLVNRTRMIQSMRVCADFS